LFFIDTNGVILTRFQISVSLDSTTTIAPAVIARQIGGGRMFAGSSLVWKALFPSLDARIDGRVPVENSSKYLIDMRFNPGKELVAVCFVPTSEEHEEKFNELISFLTGKGYVLHAVRLSSLNRLSLFQPPCACVPVGHAPDSSSPWQGTIPYSPHEG